MTNFNSPDSSKNSPNVTEWEVAQSLPCVCGNKDTEWSSTEADETYCPKCGKQSICGQWPQAMHQPVELPEDEPIEPLQLEYPLQQIMDWYNSPNAVTNQRWAYFDAVCRHTLWLEQQLKREIVTQPDIDELADYLRSRRSAWEASGRGRLFDQEREVVEIVLEKLRGRV